MKHIFFVEHVIELIDNSVAGIQIQRGSKNRTLPVFKGSTFVRISNHKLAKTDYCKKYLYIKWSRLVNHSKTEYFVRFLDDSLAKTVLYIKLFYIKRSRLMEPFKNWKSKMSGFRMVRFWILTELKPAPRFNKLKCLKS